MFENRVLRRICWPKRDGVTGEWRKLHNEELNYLYCSSNIVRVIQSRGMRWAGHVACTRREDVYAGFGGVREYLEDPGVDGKIILRLIFRICDAGGGGMGWIALAQDRDRRRALVNAVMNLRDP